MLLELENLEYPCLLWFLCSSLKSSTAGSSLVALLPTQALLFLPNVLTDNSMSQLGLGFIYLSTFSPYWTGDSPFIHLF